VRQLVVTDTGIGFPAGSRRTCSSGSRRPQRAPRASTAAWLGLAIARTDSDARRDDSRRERGQNRGATFRVRLAAPPRRRRGRGIGAARAGARGARIWRGIHVLAVDDDAVALTRCATSSKRAGARVTRRQRGARRQIARVRPDVLIADLGMPIMDGFRAIAGVRGIVDMPACRDTPARPHAYAARRSRQGAGHGFQMHLAK
jgi:hypothetical protein